MPFSGAECRFIRSSFGIGEGPFRHYTFVSPVEDEGTANDAEFTDPEMPDLEPASNELVSATPSSSHDATLDVLGIQVPVSRSISVSPSVSTASTKSNVERLRDAKTMLDEGLISHIEYDSLKSKVLGSM